MRLLVAIISNISIFMNNTNNDDDNKYHIGNKSISNGDNDVNEQGNCDNKKCWY